MKRCGRCKIDKPLVEFGLTNGRPESYCKPCRRAYNRSRWDRAKPVQRARQVRQKYGLTMAEYAAIMTQPCAICGAESQHLDHDHASGRVRGALCLNCNHMIGKAKDDPDRLRRAAAYLEGVRV